jgi:quinol monooxygenase YgiN
MSKQPLTLHTTWVIDPEQISKFYEALRPLHRMLVGEKECVYFNVFEVQGKPGTVRLVQIWDGDMHWMVEVREYFAE